MQGRSPRITALSIATALAVTTIVVNVASCATAGQGGGPGTDAAASDDGPTPDATTDTSTAGNDSGGGGDECNASTMTDPDNCGGCGIKCPSGNTCSCGLCTPPCTGTMQPCCGKCVDVSSDPNNCGTCMNVCVAPTSGDPVCQGGACTFTCPLDAGADAGGPFVLCGSDAGTPGCYNLSSAPQACGACGHACPSGDRCVDGQCCAMGDGICGGVCTPLNTAQNCGACDAGCAAPAMCMAGQCVGYVETTSAAPFVDACAISGSTVFPGLAGQGSWATSAAVTLPITFSFFGTAETKFWLGSEGTLGFGNANGLDFPDDCSGNGPPALLTDYAAIAAFGDDYLVPGKVCYATVGTAPNRQLIASWDQDTYSLGDPSFALNVSIVLSETTNTVDLLYEVPSAASDGGASDAAVDGGGDGGTTVPITDPNIQGSNATIMLQLVNTTRSTLSFCSPFLMSSPFGVHLVP